MFINASIEFDATDIDFSLDEIADMLDMLNDDQLVEVLVLAFQYTATEDIDSIIARVKQSLEIS